MAEDFEGDQAPKKIRLLDWGAINRQSRELAPKIYAALRRSSAQISIKLEKAQKKPVIVGLDFSEVGDILRDSLHDFHFKGIAEMEDVFGASLFDNPNQLALEYARERAAELVTDIEETTRGRLKELIVSTLSDGASPADLGEDIWSSSADFSEERADTIAQNELATAQGEAGVRAARETGLSLKKKWIRGNEVADCDICDPNAEAGWIDIDEDFPSGDDTVPGHPHCVCDVVFSTEDDTDTNDD
jgi:hypothetical protein